MDTTTATTEGAGRRYTLRELLGEGGFGEVYRATMVGASGLRQDVAIKLLRPELDPRSQPIARLRDEARVLAALQHPVILQVRDLVSLGGRAALVTEHVPGRDLEEVLADGGTLPARVALEVTGHVADALDTAFHAVSADGVPWKLVHRDVKPANVRVTPHGTVKLLDFGIARAEEPERETATSSMTLLGSVPYMSPEALHLDVEQPEMPRDVYALGVMLFELLTGERLFGTLTRREQRRETARVGRYEAWWASRVPLLAAEPPEVVALVERMVAFDPSDRPTAREVGEAAFELADRLPPPALRAWARQQAWTDRTEVHGPWSGRTITDHGVGASATAPLSETAPMPSPRGSEQGAPVFQQGAVARGAEGPPWWLWAVGGGLLFGGAVAGLLGAVGRLGVSGAGPETEPVPEARAVVEQADPADRPPPVAEPLPSVGQARVDSEEDPQTEASEAAEVTEERTRPRPAEAPVEPDPEPRPAPPEEVAPEPSVAMGRVRVTGADDVAIRLSRGGHRTGPGRVEAGRWTVEADFGDGWVAAPSIVVPQGGEVVLRCLKLTYTCEAR